MASASVELQDAVLAALVADAGVGALAGDRIYDQVPQGAKPPYISFGPGDFVIEDLTCIRLRLESLQIDVWTEAEGRLWPARELADAVVNALHLKELSLATHALALLRVDAVRVFKDADGITGHGVVTLEAEIEQR